MNKTLFAVIALVIILAVIAIYFYTKSKIKESTEDLSSRKDGKTVGEDGKPFTGMKDGLIYKNGLVTGSYKASSNQSTPYADSGYCINGMRFINGYPQNKKC